LEYQLALLGDVVETPGDTSTDLSQSQVRGQNFPAWHQSPNC